MNIRNLSSCVLAGATAFPRDTGSVMWVVQQSIGEARNAIARNRAQLRLYVRTDTIEITLKWEMRKRERNSCRFGPDGKVLSRRSATFRRHRAVRSSAE
jgi:hypothetical protein